MNPELAILIPHFNQLRDLDLSIASLEFKQDLLILVVDDGSEPGQQPTEAWRKGWETRTGHQFALLALGENRGIEAALNAGLKFLLKIPELKYIARMDCGDRNVPHRLDSQFEFMEKNPHVHLLGSWVNVEQNDQVQYTLRMPVKHSQINRRMLINNCFVHPTVMFRNSGLHAVGFYPTQYPAAEDYAFFFRFVRKFETANYPEVLMHIHKDPKGISLKKRRTQLISRMKVILHNFRLNGYAIWGLARTALFLVLPTSLIEFTKKVAWNDRTAHH